MKKIFNDSMKKVIEKWEKQTKGDKYVKRGKSVLVVADTHIPFHHPDYLAFCKRIEKAFNCGIVVHIGGFGRQPRYFISRARPKWVEP